MIIEIREDYPGELAARDPTEVANAIVAQIAFSKGHGAGGYKTPADFQNPMLWKLHSEITGAGRRRLERLKHGVFEALGGEA